MKAYRKHQQALSAQQMQKKETNDQGQEDKCRSRLQTFSRSWSFGRLFWWTSKKTDSSDKDFLNSRKESKSEQYQSRCPIFI